MVETGGPGKQDADSERQKPKSMRVLAGCGLDGS